jgi:hypothetical protein
MILLTIIYNEFNNFLVFEIMELKIDNYQATKIIRSYPTNCA